MKFVRGQDPKEAMGLGVESLLKEIDGIIVRAEDFLPVPKSITELKEGFRFANIDRPTLAISREIAEKAVFIIAIIGNKYKLIKDKNWLINESDNIKTQGDISELPTLIEGLKKLYTWSNGGFRMPTMQKVQSKSISMDLVSVKPMKPPSGLITHLEYNFK